MKIEIQQFEELYLALDELYQVSTNEAIYNCLQEVLEKMAPILIKQRVDEMKKEI